MVVDWTAGRGGRGGALLLAVQGGQRLERASSPLAANPHAQLAARRSSPSMSGSSQPCTRNNFAGVLTSNPSNRNSWRAALAAERGRRR